MIIATEEFLKYNDGNHWHFTGTEYDEVKALQVSSGFGEIVMEGKELCWDRYGQRMFERYHIVTLG